MGKGGTAIRQHLSNLSAQGGSPTACGHVASPQRGVRGQELWAAAPRLVRMLSMAVGGGGWNTIVLKEDGGPRDDAIRKHGVGEGECGSHPQTCGNNLCPLTHPAAPGLETPEESLPGPPEGPEPIDGLRWRI